MLSSCIGGEGQTESFFGAVNDSFDIGLDGSEWRELDRAFSFRERTVCGRNLWYTGSSDVVGQSDAVGDEAETFGNIAEVKSTPIITRVEMLNKCQCEGYAADIADGDRLCGRHVDAAMSRISDKRTIEGLRWK